MALSSNISPLKYLPAHIEEEPVFNVLHSLSLLNVAGDLTGLNSWVMRTAAALTPERKRMNVLVCEGLKLALPPTQAYQETTDFPSYLQDLSEQDPTILRDRLLERLCRATCVLPAADANELLHTVQGYIARIKQVFPEQAADVELVREVHTLLNNPSSLQEVIILHLRFMWKATLQIEWKRIGKTLTTQVNVYKQRLFPDASTVETFRLFTGREIPAHVQAQAKGLDIQRIVLVPSAHPGRHVTSWYNDGVLRLFFLAPPNFSAVMRTSPIGHAEMIANLKRLADVLADETRLRILELFVHYNELSAQDIMQHLAISQSSVSRHLKQLVNVGYLFEQREGANKLYTFSFFAFDSTIRALEQFKAGATFESDTDAALANYPRELKRFLDTQGRLSAWPPAKERDKVLLLDYLIENFEVGQTYSEKEVNEILQHHLAFNDYAGIRRALQEYRFMRRDRDGSRYWRISKMPDDNETSQMQPDMLV